MNISRRAIFKATAATTLVNSWAPVTWAISTSDQINLTASAQALSLDSQGDKTDVWGYSLDVIYMQKNIPTTIKVLNSLVEETTVHWHGMRVENNMDGVSGLTQSPILPGEEFTYSILPKDAGTYWAHSHHDTYRQLALGLYIPIIVKETNPYPVDQDILFVADDWLLNRKKQIDVDSLEDMHAWSHGGRMGNMLTINRSNTPEFQIVAGQQIRLRVMNTANSRVMKFDFPDVIATIIAKDGQPITQPTRLNKSLTIAPAERYDLVIDIPNNWQGQYPIIESSGRKPFIAAIWNAKTSEKNTLKPTVQPLPPNPLPDKTFTIHRRIKLDMQGGAMGNLQSAKYQGKQLTVRELIKNKQMWTFNGIANMPQEPLSELKLGEGIEIELINATRWPHAMHLHGHHFLTTNEHIDGPVWQDTVLVLAGETKKIRFIAQEPGKWLLHCHMIEHQVSGMVTFVEVTS